MRPEIPPLTLARDQLGPDLDRRQLARATTAGRNIRVARGAYLPVDVWSGLETEDRYLTLIAAITSTARNKPLYSHESAVALWGLPSMGQWPVEVHVTVAPSLGTRSRNRVIRHAAVVPDEDVVDCGTYYLTSLARTILDIAATSPFMHAVVMTDRALLVDRYHRADPMLTREQLESAWGTCAATASALANTRSPVICRNARRITPGVG